MIEILAFFVGLSIGLLVAGILLIVQAREYEETKVLDAKKMKIISRTRAKSATGGQQND